MQVKSIIVSLFLAATAAAAPAGLGGNGWPSLPTNSNSFNNIGNGIGKDTQNNPSIGSDDGSNDGNGNTVGNDDGSNNGNGNTIGSNNGNGSTFDSHNEILNFENGANSRQVSEEVVAAMKSLTLICRSSNSEGVMSFIPDKIDSSSYSDNIVQYASQLIQALDYWLSRQSNTLKVSGSSPGEIMNCKVPCRNNKEQKEEAVLGDDRLTQHQRDSPRHRNTPQTINPQNVVSTPISGDVTKGKAALPVAATEPTPTPTAGSVIPAPEQKSATGQKKKNSKKKSNKSSKKPQASASSGSSTFNAGRYYGYTLGEGLGYSGYSSSMYLTWEDEYKMQGPDHTQCCSDCDWCGMCVYRDPY
ncbi:hypothetical protein CIB48_g2564 [Xylaria polymorpha]|nr:hypothetical protein CIB48_g2564 [Xylaria polymorpha]